MVSLIQPSFSKGEINSELFGRVDTATYKIGLATARNVVVRTTGGVINRPGLEFIGLQYDMNNPSRLRRFRFNVADTYMLEFGNRVLRVIRDDAYVTETPLTITAITNAYPAQITIASHGYAVGDDIEFAVVGMPRLTGRRLRVGGVIDANNVTVNDIITSTPIDSTAFGTFVSGTAARIYSPSTPYVQADLATLKFVQSADVMTITHPNYPESKLTRTGNAAWTLTAATFAPPTTAPGMPTVTPQGTVGTTIAYYQVTCTDATTGVESLPSPYGQTSTGNVTSNNLIAWTPVANALLYSVYKAVNGVFGFVGDTPNTNFTENNIAPLLSTTPPSARNPFLGAGYYPACATYYQQRLVRGGSNAFPDQLNYSRTADFYNFATSTPSAADDSIQATLTSREVNAIKHMVPVKDLLVFTAGGEWRINSTGSGFSTSTMEQLSQSTWGCSDLEPIVIGLTTLFVPEAKISVRSFSYTYISDAYTGQDLTLLSAHLFQQYPLVDWGYSRAPDPIIYSVRADGQAMCFTYQDEQQVSAWTRWDTLGKFESVDVVRPNTDQPDEIPYFGTVRTVNGYPVRMVERMHSRRFTDVRDCFFVDAGLTYDNPTPITGVMQGNPCGVTAPGHGLVNGQWVDISDIVWVSSFDDSDNEVQPDQLNDGRFIVANATTNGFTLLDIDTGLPIDATGFAAYVSGGNVRLPVNTVAGLDHLEGRIVQALADGNVVEDLTVTNGSIKLPFAASRIHCGLKYISDVETLDLEVPQGTIQGVLKRTYNVTVRFNLSRGLFVGQNSNELIEIKQRQDDVMGAPTALFSGDQIVILGSAWNEQGRVFLRQRYPLPMDILDIIPNMEMGG